MRTAVVLIGSVVVLAAGAPAALSQPTSEPSEITGAAVFQSEEEALSQDLRLVAESRGWTFEETEADHRAAELVGAIAERIAAERADVLIGSVLSPQPGGVAAIYVKGPADRLVLDLATGIAVTIVDNQPFSFEELEERKLVVHHALEVLGFRHIVTWFDVAAGGRINAAVTAEDGLESDPSKIVASLPSSLRDSVTVEVSDTPVAEPA